MVTFAQDYAGRIYNRLAAGPTEGARNDCADIAGEADDEIALLRKDAELWRLAIALHLKVNFPTGQVYYLPHPASSVHSSVDDEPDVGRAVAKAAAAMAASK